MEGTVFTPALEGIKTVKSEQGEILSQPFLDVCKHILPVIGASSWFLILLFLQYNLQDMHKRKAIMFFVCLQCVFSLYLAMFYFVRGIPMVIIICIIQHVNNMRFVGSLLDFSLSKMHISDFFHGGLMFSCPPASLQFTQK